MRSCWTLWITRGLLAARSLPVSGQQTAQPLVTPLTGTVEVRRSPDVDFESLPEPQRVPPAAVVRTRTSGMARVEQPDGTTVTIKPGSVVQLTDDDGESVWVQLGAVLMRVQRLLGSEPKVRTPVAVAAVRGTEFGVLVEESLETRVYTFSGSVAVHNVLFPDREVLVGSGR